MFDEAGSVDILSGIKSKTDPQDPYLILFVGINGTGKTTNIAKIANLFQKNNNWNCSSKWSILGLVAIV